MCLSDIVCGNNTDCRDKWRPHKVQTTFDVAICGQRKRGLDMTSVLTFSIWSGKMYDLGT